MRANPYTEGGVRLQKVLAQAGVASRRASEQMIADGRVSVDGTVVRSQGVRVDPATQVIHVDGERLILDETKHIVLAVNKPIGTVSTMSDPEGRPSIADLIADYPERLYHVGRLDIDTSGLLLLTNDGELANRLTHPKYEIRKTYVARLHGDVKPGVKRKLRTVSSWRTAPSRLTPSASLTPTATSRPLRSSCTRAATVWCAA